MADSSLQEKFQITVPPKRTSEDEGDNWAWQDGAGTTARKVNDAGFRHRRNPDADSIAPNGVKFNQLPPGMELGNQMRLTQGQMPLTTSSEKDVTPIVGADAYKAGFARHEMKGTDDQYTGEHVDLFYGEAVGEDDTGKRYVGFMERNNYLDRL